MGTYPVAVQQETATARMSAGKKLKEDRSKKKRRGRAQKS